MRARGTPSEAGRIAVAVLLAAALAAGVGIGYLLGTRASEPEISEVRKGFGRLTNPLLECDAEESGVQGSLSDFRDGLQALASRAVDAGQVERIGIYYRDLNSGDWLGVDEDATFTPASLLKVPVAIAALKQAGGDPAFLDREVLFTGINGIANQRMFQAEKQIVPGNRYRVGELARRAIVYSDNAAAALLAFQIDRRILRDLVVVLGLPSSLAEDFLRPVAISPQDYSRFFRVLYNATYLDQGMSERVLQMLTESTFKNGLAAGLPVGTLVAHKFGISASGPKEFPQLHDCGIVYLPGRPYFLCVMTTGSDYAALEKVIGEMSRFVYTQTSGAPK